MFDNIRTARDKPGEPSSDNKLIEITNEAKQTFSNSANGHNQTREQQDKTYLTCVARSLKCKFRQNLKIKLLASHTTIFSPKVTCGSHDYREEPTKEIHQV